MGDNPACGQRHLAASERSLRELPRWRPDSQASLPPCSCFWARLAAMDDPPPSKVSNQGFLVTTNCSQNDMTAVRHLLCDGYAVGLGWDTIVHTQISAYILSLRVSCPASNALPHRKINKIQISREFSVVQLLGSSQFGVGPISFVRTEKHRFTSRLAGSTPMTPSRCDAS